MRRRLSDIFVERLKACPSVPRAREACGALASQKLVGIVGVPIRLSPAGGIPAEVSE